VAVGSTLPECLSPSPDAVPHPPAIADVLVVDDEEPVRSLVTAILHAAGFRVHAAANGPEALDLFSSHPGDFDLVILDYVMPDMDGTEVMRELRRLVPSVKVILSSGHSSCFDLRDLVAAGVTAFLPKPYRPQDLLRVVRDVLAS
jgi:CheY-like chemotaxis protein